MYARLSNAAGLQLPVAEQVYNLFIYIPQNIDFDTYTLSLLPIFKTKER